MSNRVARVTGTTAAMPAAAGADAAPAVLRDSAMLLADALASDDAEDEGLHADDVLADPERAVAVLGGPDAWVAARTAVVQRYGRVGALVVLGYEERWRSRHVPSADRRQDAVATQTSVAERLEALLDGFAELDASELHELLADLDRAAGAPADDDVAEARRWLHVTYAVAARDGTDAAHRAYMQALDRVLRQARARIAS